VVEAAMMTTAGAVEGAMIPAAAVAVAAKAGAAKAAGKAAAKVAVGMMTSLGCPAAVLLRPDTSRR
jgi:hypothetical protein